MPGQLAPPPARLPLLQHGVASGLQLQHVGLRGGPQRQVLALKHRRVHGLGHQGGVVGGDLGAARLGGVGVGEVARGEAHPVGFSAQTLGVHLVHQLRDADLLAQRDLVVRVSVVEVVHVEHLRVGGALLGPAPCQHQLSPGSPLLPQDPGLLLRRLVLHPVGGLVADVLVRLEVSVPLAGEGAGGEVGGEDRLLILVHVLHEERRPRVIQLHPDLHRVAIDLEVNLHQDE